MQKCGSKVRVCFHAMADTSNKANSNYKPISTQNSTESQHEQDSQHKKSSVQENCGLSVKSKKLYVFGCLVVILLVIISVCALLKQVNSDGEKQSKTDGMPYNPTAETMTGKEHVFLSCSHCEPMSRAEDVEIRYEINKTYICCKTSQLKFQIPNTGKLLEKCQAHGHPFDEKNRTAALLYINLRAPKCSEGGILYWNGTTDSKASYIKGGIKYEDVPHGKLRVPSRGMYAVYSYLQFDLYTHDVIMKRPKPGMHALYKNGAVMLNLNKFMLRKDSYTHSQIGPIIVELEAHDTIYVSVSNSKLIHSDQRLSLFGIYKL